MARPKRAVTTAKAAAAKTAEPKTTEVKATEVKEVKAEEKKVVEEKAAAKTTAKKTTRKPDSGKLFQNPSKNDIGSGRNSSLKQENVALKALQDENRIAQERKKIKNDYVRLVLKKEKDLWEAQNAIAKKYGSVLDISYDENRFTVMTALKLLPEKKNQ